MADQAIGDVPSGCAATEQASRPIVRLIDRQNEFLRAPAWRTRTTPAKRRAAAIATLIGLVVVGGASMVGVMWLLDVFGAPTWIVVMPWLAPTVGLVVWAIVDGDPATLTDAPDGSWAGYVVRWTLGGAGEPPTTARRPTPARVIVATLVGAPIAYAYLLFALAALVGLN